MDARKLRGSIRSIQIRICNSGTVAPSPVTRRRSFAFREAALLTEGDLDEIAGRASRGRRELDVPIDRTLRILMLIVIAALALSCIVSCSSPDRQWRDGQTMLENLPR